MCLLNLATSDFKMICNLLMEADNNPSTVTDDYFTVLRSLPLTGKINDDVSLLASAFLARYERIEKEEDEDEYWIYGVERGQRVLLQYHTSEQSRVFASA